MDQERNNVNKIINMISRDMKYDYIYKSRKPGLTIDFFLSSPLAAFLKI